MSQDAFAERAISSCLSALSGEALPLVAFTILSGADSFERDSQLARRPADKSPSPTERAGAFAAALDLSAAPGAETHLPRVRADVARMLSGNPTLIERLERGRHLAVHVGEPKDLARLGFPAGLVSSAAGLFWDHPDWPEARIGLRADILGGDPTVVFHELGHALHHVAMTEAERRLIYQRLLPSYGGEPEVDEVFAIYSEREIHGSFVEQKRHVPGIWGQARREWHEDHVLTRFVRKLYWPMKPLAGPGMKPLGADAWQKGLGRRR